LKSGKITVTPRTLVEMLVDARHRWDARDGRELVAVAARVRRLARELELDGDGCYALCGPLLEGLAGRRAGRASSVAGAEIVASALSREKRRRAAARVEEPLT
jgi:hypothetical protein